MSKIQDVPFITKVIDTLSDELKSGLYDLIDGQVKTPVFRSLVNNDYAITEANDKGKVQFVTLETLRGNYTGYLAYNSVYCVLIAFKGNTQALDMLNINVAKHTFSFVNEALTILELRVELEDGKEGATPTDLGVTNNNIHLAKGTTQIGEGVNFKTINGASIMGDGNIVVGEGGTITIDETPSTTSENALMNKTITNTFATKEAMEKLDQSLKDTIIETKNVVPDAVYNEGKYCAGISNGVPIYADDSTQYTLQFDCYGGVPYRSSNLFRAVFSWFYDSVTGNVVRMAETDITMNEYVPEHDGYIIITVSTTIPHNKIIVMQNGYPTYPATDGYVEFRSKYSDPLFIGANRNIKSLVEGIAIAESKFGTDVYVDSGVYDLYEELGGDEYFNNFTMDSSNGVELKNGIKLHFSPNSKVVFNYTGNNDAVKINFSPFCSGQYGFTLDGLYLYSSNCRYGVHDERYSLPDTYFNNYINCHFYHDNTDNTAWQPKNIIGGGLGRNGTIRFNGCYFESVNLSNNSQNLSYHNGSADDCFSNILVENCYFKEGTAAMTYFGTSQKISQMKVTGCRLRSEPYIAKTTETSNVVNVEILAWNNIIE